MDEHVANEARLLAGLDPDERAALGDLLGRLATSLGRLRRPPRLVRHTGARPGPAAPVRASRYR